MQITAPATRQALSAMLQESSHLAQALELTVGPDAEVFFSFYITLKSRLTKVHEP